MSGRDDLPSFRELLVRGSRPAVSDRTVRYAGAVGVATLAALSIVGAASAAGAGAASSPVFVLGACLLGATLLAGVAAFRGAGVIPALALVSTPVVAALVVAAVANVARVALIDGSFDGLVVWAALNVALPAWVAAYLGGAGARWAYYRSKDG
jgi:hypothetical protein